ncbi:MAG: hypothetical protein GKR77_05400 [Legionellales bacterium]|nr:hypothetical protein [Legionellales bacterium]
MQPLAKEVGDGVCEVTSDACEDKTSVSLSGNFNETFGKVFLDMLRAGMREHRWTINQPDALMFRVESGWLVTMSLVQMFLNQQKEPMTCEAFVDVLQAQHLLACEKEKAVVDYLNLALTPPVCVRGVVVLTPVLDEDMGGAPYRFLKSMRQLGES